MTSITGRPHVMFTIEIDLGDHFESATTQVIHEGYVVKVYERSSPTSSSPILRTSPAGESQCLPDE